MLIVENPTVTVKWRTVITGLLFELASNCNFYVRCDFRKNTMFGLFVGTLLFDVICVPLRIVACNGYC